MSEPPYYPPPPGWKPTPPFERTPEEIAPNVVLPQPRRVRESVDEPEPEPVREPELARHAAATNISPRAPESVPPPPIAAEPRSTWKQRRIPAWLLLAFAWLGLAFLVFKPLGLTDWLGYGVAVVFAVLIGILARTRYHSRILWESKGDIIVWQRWGKGDLPADPPVVVTPVGEDLSATAEGR